MVEAVMDDRQAGIFVAERVRVERADAAAVKAFVLERIDELLAENENERSAGALRIENLALGWLRHAELGLH